MGGKDLAEDSRSLFENMFLEFISESRKSQLNKQAVWTGFESVPAECKPRAMPLYPYAGRLCVGSLNRRR
jgi:hypothetical protein